MVEYIMEKQAGRQLDLFSQSQDNPRVSGSNPERNSFLARIWGYEKTILIIIALLITGIISFSSGVEKGKRITANQPLLVNLKVKDPDKDLTLKNSVVPKEVVVEVPLKLAEKSKQPVLAQQGPYSAEAHTGASSSATYTIQVASFKAKLNAQKEAELLKKKGFTALVLNKGKYVILCVGNFPNKETAQPLLSELSKYYRSCYIRKVK